MVLSYPAQANALTTLRDMFQGDQCWRTVAVTQEIQNHPPSRAALGELWVMEEDYPADLDDLVFGLLDFLGGDGDENLGEAESIALARAHDAVVITDDNGAHSAAAKWTVLSFSTLDVLERAVAFKRVSYQVAADFVNGIKALVDEDENPLNRGLTFTTGAAFLAAYGFR